MLERIYGFSQLKKYICLKNGFAEVMEEREDCAFLRNGKVIKCTLQTDGVWHVT